MEKPKANQEPNVVNPLFNRFVIAEPANHALDLWGNPFYILCKTGLSAIRALPSNSVLYGCFAQEYQDGILH